MAEEVGFEPTELSFNGFQDRRLKPLGHSSGSPADSIKPAPVRLEQGGVFLSCSLRQYGTYCLTHFTEVRNYFLLRLLRLQAL